MDKKELTLRSLFLGSGGHADCTRSVVITKAIVKVYRK